MGISFAFDVSGACRGVIRYPLAWLTDQSIEHFEAEEGALKQWLISR
jgi:hypothetical protein